MNIGPAMPRQDMVKWAKEEILSTIDNHFRNGNLPEDFDENAELLKQRNRVAKFLGLYQIRTWEIGGTNEGS